MSADPVWATRLAVPPLVLGRPDGIPAGRWPANRTDASVGPALCEMAQTARAHWADRGRVHALVEQALRMLGPCETPAAPEPADCLTAAEPHDAYFRLQRCEDAPETALLRGQLHGLRVFIDEVQDDADYAAYGLIAQALIQTWCDLVGAPELPAGSTPPGTRPEMLRTTAAPVRRWLRGHQVFAVLTQGLIWAMKQLPQAVHAPTPQAGACALDRVRLMMDASAVAFRFTADFDPVHYRDTIRPSMSEPHVPPGFSGTLSCDHAHLVRLMASLRPELLELQQRHPEIYAGMRQALAAVYEDHKFVCEQFDGAEAPSLKGAQSRQTSQLSGAEMLDRFKSRRMVMVG